MVEVWGLLREGRIKLFYFEKDVESNWGYRGYSFVFVWEIVVGIGKFVGVREVFGGL